MPKLFTGAQQAAPPALAHALGGLHGPSAGEDGEELVMSLCVVKLR